MRRFTLITGAVVLSLLMISSVWGVAPTTSGAGVITKINGHAITVKTAAGQLVTVTGDPAGLAVGNAVTLENGKLVGPNAGKTTSPHRMTPGETIGINPQPEPPGEAIGINPQPEPPGDAIGINPQPEPPGKSKTLH